MDSKLHFTEDDKHKFVEFLNQVGKYATWNVSTNQLIDIFKNLSHMQQTMLPKINANIFEITKVVEVEQEKPVEKQPTKKK